MSNEISLERRRRAEEVAERIRREMEERFARAGIAWRGPLDGAAAGRAEVPRRAA
jgi:hypothetical protein